MYQQIQGIWMEIYDFDTMPPLPVYGLTDFERECKNLIEAYDYPNENTREEKLMLFWRQFKHAEALTQAIREGIITEPGKYGIQIVADTEYVVHKIIE